MLLFRFVTILLLSIPTASLLGQVPGARGLPANPVPSQGPSQVSQALPPGYQPFVRWEYAVWEVRTDFSRRSPVFRLHLPTRSSKPSENWMQSFLNSGVAVQRAGRVDEVNAMNSLGMAGWELVTITTKESATERVVHHYFKRPSYHPSR